MDHIPENPRYTEYHPKWYRTRMPIFWWIHEWPHIRFITRELTSVFVAGYAIVLLLFVRALTKGPQAYEAFLTCLKSPVSIALSTIALLFVIFHSVTWFNLAPKALVLHLGKKRIPGVMIVTSNYVAWGIVSIVVAWIILKA